MPGGGAVCCALTPGMPGGARCGGWAVGMAGAGDEAAVLPDLLPVYYRRLFPYPQYFRWLNYGGVRKAYFQNREFSFTLRDDIYLRYQSFTNQQELEKEMQKLVPYKIDIGAVYSHKPNQHNSVKAGNFQALEKELVFDIDMTDYDDVRNCCRAADICHKCWTLMTIAIRVLDRALEEDFGFEHRLWVYSGRRGVHCWVCDDIARKLSQTARSAVAEYLSVVKGGEDTIKKVHLTHPIHPSIEKAIVLVKRYFREYALENQDILGSKEAWEKVLAMVPEEIRENLQTEFINARNSDKRWDMLKQSVKTTKAIFTAEEIMLQYCYPRLDVNVSKGLNHLLKSPFCVHPKTGRISVPIDLKTLDSFDPFSVPTLSSICRELDSNKKPEEEDVTSKESEPESKRRSRDYKKTSLAEPVRIFDEFLKKMEHSRKGVLLEQSDSHRDF
ncbi:DNA primase small subunit isoform X2 [Callorhinchus milii]|nr:DNA primase small subunit isoform X2 [Callorhinchus milii]|eukprot:gi/632982556/ref/XP_007908201.1/ PREDICTED: DNA primase small subunit [Callorhinchus milii]